MLEARELGYAVGQSSLVSGVSVSFAPGRFHVVMGPNGAGKSTLLKLLAGSLKPSSGAVILNGRDLSAYSSIELAKQRAVLSQNYSLLFPIPVIDVVLMGRYPYFDLKPSAEDVRICRDSMAMMDIAQLADRNYGTLSGGEAQKVQMCRVLSQVYSKESAKPRILFLDEPVSHLDVKYQHQLLQLARRLCNEGITVIAVLHELNLAITYADRLYFMKDSGLVNSGIQPFEISASVLEEVFEIPVTIMRQDGQLYVQFRSPSLS